MKILQKIVRFFIAIPMLPAVVFGGTFFSLMRYAMDGTFCGFAIVKEDIVVFSKWLVFIDAEIT